MTAALAEIGDQYRSPDGVLYSLTDQPALDACAPEVSLMRQPTTALALAKRKRWRRRAWSATGAATNLSQ
jgi:hypothetical protein